MITLNALRGALQSDQPWSELDRLVVTELSSGRTTKQVFDELHGMWKEIHNWTEVSEDGKDAFGDTLDALTGNCHKDFQYKDPPNNTLPSEEEIANLPRWARVAFAARCARRVFPLLRHFWQESPNQYASAVVHAIESAEESAILGSVDASSIESIATDAVVAAGAARTIPRAAAVARAAKTAADSDPIAYQYADAGRVWDAALAAVEAADSSVVNFLRRDFDHLLNLSKWQHWTDDTPVPPEVFGPLWPEGPPKGWPPITDIPRRNGLSLAFFARERPTAPMIEDDVVNLFDAINRYHISRGGVPLTYEDLRSLLPALIPAEV